MDETANPRIAQTIKEFIATQHASIPLADFLTNFLLAALLGAGMAFLYVRYGTTFSNRRQFAKNFVLLCMATTLIISIVKSSLALSLGLVGALSIVRFRAAIKDPEELVFLFLTISLGLGLGAGQIQVTLLGFLIIAAVVVSRGYFSGSAEPEDICVSVSAAKKSNVDARLVLSILKKHCTSVAFKRMEEDEKLRDLAFIVTVERFEDLVAARDAIAEADGVARLVILDNQAVAY